MPSPSKPLTGIRILEFGGYISGPYATSILNSLGAEVIKVEKLTGDDFRRRMDHKNPYFIQYNAGKKSIAVDLKSETGVQVIKSLLPRFDVLVENLRPGKMANLGLSTEECRHLNPDLIYVSVTGFGKRGPLRDRPAYDTIGQAFGGLYSFLSPAGGTGLSGTILADLITGCMTATGVLASLLGRQGTGRGGVVETSIMESVSTITIDAMTQYFATGADPTLVSRHPQAQNFCLKTSAGGDLAVHLSNSQQFWSRLCEAMERPDLREDERFRDYADRETNYAELAGEIATVFSTRDTAEWERLLLEHDVPFAPVLGMSDYARHEQVTELELLSRPEGGEGPSLVQPPWQFDGERPRRQGATPRIGEHTMEVIGEVRDRAAVEQMIASRVLGAAPDQIMV